MPARARGRLGAGLVHPREHAVKRHAVGVIGDVRHADGHGFKVHAFSWKAEISDQKAESSDKYQ
jgi:hypothetical protein